ncbi:MAG: hypothetical protein ACP5HJ_00520 [Candidatus Micrarchaeia archaeon]|jgi:hypothetical protein
MKFEEEIAKVLLSEIAIIASFWVLFSSSLGFLGLIAFFFLLSLMALLPLTMFFDYLVLPFFTYVFGITEVPAEGYEITKKQDAVVKYVNGVYYAIGYLGASIYEYILRREEPEENLEGRFIQSLELWERAIANIKFPMKFEIITFQRDLVAARRELEEQRDYWEYRLSKEMQATMPNAMEIDNIQRKIRILDVKLNRMSAGEKPLGVLMFASIYSCGLSKEAALKNLEATIKEATVTLGNALDLKISRLYGRDLRNAFLLEYVIPPSEKELDSIL